MVAGGDTCEDFEEVLPGWCQQVYQVDDEHVEGGSTSLNSPLKLLVELAFREEGSQRPCSLLGGAGEELDEPSLAPGGVVGLPGLFEAALRQKRNDAGEEILVHLS